MLQIVRTHTLSKVSWSLSIYGANSQPLRIATCGKWGGSTQSWMMEGAETLGCLSVFRVAGTTIASQIHVPGDSGPEELALHRRRYVSVPDRHGFLGLPKGARRGRSKVRLPEPCATPVSSRVAYPALQIARWRRSDRPLGAAIPAG